jgi:hypothetical protein
MMYLTVGAAKPVEVISTEPPITCGWCGRTFVPTERQVSRGAKYCDYDCRKRSDAHKRRQRERAARLSAKDQLPLPFAEVA